MSRTEVRPTPPIDVATLLGKRPGTVRTQRQHVYKRLGVRARLELARRLADGPTPDEPPKKLRL